MAAGIQTIFAAVLGHCEASSIMSSKTGFHFIAEQTNSLTACRVVAENKPRHDPTIDQAPKVRHDFRIKKSGQCSRNRKKHRGILASEPSTLGLPSTTLFECSIIRFVSCNICQQNSFRASQTSSTWVIYLCSACASITFVFRIARTLDMSRVSHSAASLPS